MRGLGVVTLILFTQISVRSHCNKSCIPLADNKVKTRLIIKA
jgi:hypothetical protein